MRGKVITYSDTEGRGLISGDDGRRYAFVRGELGAGLRAVYHGVGSAFLPGERNGSGSNRH